METYKWVKRSRRLRMDLDAGFSLAGNNLGALSKPFIPSGPKMKLWTPSYVWWNPRKSRRQKSLPPSLECEKILATRGQAGNLIWDNWLVPPRILTLQQMTCKASNHFESIWMVPMGSAVATTTPNHNAPRACYTCIDSYMRNLRLDLSLHLQPCYELCDTIPIHRVSNSCNQEPY